MMEFSWLHAVLAFNTAVCLLHFYLDKRQQRALCRPKPHPAVAHLYSDAEFEKKRSYNLAKLQFSSVQNLWDSALTAAMLLAGFLPATWQLAGVLLARWGGGRPWLQGDVAQSVVWVLLQAAASLLLSLPWSAWSTFVLEARHGFNKTSPATFIADKCKGVLLGLLFLPPIIAAFTAILQRSSPYVGLYLWAFLLAVQLFVVTVYPTVIAPLFNTSAIEQLAASLSFPLKKLFVVDGSRRSAHSNAYMYGFGANKRICLYDTLIEQASQEQVVAVLAHELGHWKLGHMPKLLVASQIVSLAQLLLFTAVRTSSAVFVDFGFPPGVRPALAGFLLFQQLIGPVDEVLGLLSNLVSRTFEFQADAFAASCGKADDLKGALLVLDKENKGALASDPLYSAYHYSHPPLVERLAALDAAGKKAL
ncbi:hypothetical protein COHA_003788 [Chlorella ohadii]|uniref:CAAX prenyl protease n=1 Tax=Chlorella ohadii TaxID=2649997 RepID=A0AAD5DUL0_9CHLO|nr:hypothetical protein COHA_003788 [Chlorella ohadii]